MRTSRPATRSFLSCAQVFSQSLDMLETGLSFFNYRHPAYPLIASKRCQSIPCFGNFFIREESFTHVIRELMDDAREERDFFGRHGYIVFIFLWISSLYEKFQYRRRLHTSATHGTPASPMRNPSNYQGNSTWRGRRYQLRYAWIQISRQASCVLHVCKKTYRILPDPIVSREIQQRIIGLQNFKRRHPIPTGSSISLGTYQKNRKIPRTRK